MNISPGLSRLLKGGIALLAPGSGADADNSPLAIQSAHDDAQMETAHRDLVKLSRKEMKGRIL